MNSALGFDAVSREGTSIVQKPPRVNQPDPRHILNVEF